MAERAAMGEKRVNINFLQVFVQTDALGNHPVSTCLTYKTSHDAPLSTTETKPDFSLSFSEHTAAYFSPKHNLKADSISAAHTHALMT